MQKYNMLQAFFMSFYSRDLYRDVAKNWGGKAYLYLLLLVILSSIPITILLQTAANSSYKAYSAKIMPQLPVLDIKNGEITTPENRPYFLKDPETQKTIAIIDTTGQYTTLEQAQTDFLLTKTDFISRRSSHEVRIDTLPKDITMKVDPQTLDQYIQKFVGLAWVVIFVFLVPLFYIYRLLLALFYSLIGKLYSAMTGANVKFGEIMQISLIAITPSFVLQIINMLFALHVPHMGLISFLLALFYLFFGISANKNVTRDNEIKPGPTAT